jgi:hypothetical protein
VLWRANIIIAAADGCGTAPGVLAAVKPGKEQLETIRQDTQEVPVYEPVVLNYSTLHEDVLYLHQD